jgi:superfamily I DNA and/or RNA helicase
MFERLHLAGLPVVNLGVQYRCHPHISAVSNRLFYNGILKDGAGYTKPVIEGLPHICFVDVRDGHEQTTAGNGSFNPKEAEFVVSLVHELTSRGISPNDMLYYLPLTHLAALYQCTHHKFHASSLLSPSR